MSSNQEFITIDGKTLTVEGCRVFALELLKGEAYQKELGEFLLFLLDDAKQTITIETSGSTGKPKKIEVTKSQLFSSAKVTIEILGLKKGDVALLALPLKYIGGKMMVVRAVEAGLNLILTKPSNQILTESLPAEIINFTALTPAQLHPILENKEAFKQLNKIEKLIIGGATVNIALKRALEGVKTNVFEAYGMTETLSHIALRRLAPFNEETFKALNGVQLEIDEEGCLIINCPSRGVKNLKTNDIVKLQSDNSFVLKGRKDNVINSGGVKIHPEMMESDIENLLKRKVIISYTNHEKFGQEIVLVLEGEDLNKEETSLVLSQIKSSLNYPVYPKKVVVYPFFPMTESGKKNRKVVAELLNSNQ